MREMKDLTVPAESPPPATGAVRTYRYRLLPTAKQHGALERILESQRVLYNAALQERTDAPGIRARHERRLRRAQRALQRCQKGSANRAKRRNALARLHLRTANARDTHLHQQSAFLTRTYGTIVVERLSIPALTASTQGTTDAPGKNVRGKSALNRNILDVAWGRFRTQLRYKAESAGGRVIEVSPHMTSQTCSGCGTVVRKSLAERTHECPSCGLVVDRDVNAARNILARGLALLDETSGAPSPDRGVVAPGRPNVGAVMAACRQKSQSDSN